MYFGPNLHPSAGIVPPYSAGDRCGPRTRTFVEVTAEVILAEARKKSLVRIIAVRPHAEEKQEARCWTGFNIYVRSKVQVPQDVIGYLPTIDAPATDITLYEVLVQSLKIKSTLKLKSIVLVYEQTLYAKATDVQWSQSERFKDIALRMGVFHTACTLLSIIGKRVQDAGLRDLCVESGEIAEGSVAGVLDGRRYNRGVRLRKIL